MPTTSLLTHSFRKDTNEIIFSASMLLELLKDQIPSLDNIKEELEIYNVRVKLFIENFHTKVGIFPYKLSVANHIAGFNHITDG